MSTPFRFHDGTLTLTLHVQPSAAKTEMAGLHGEAALRLRLAAPAREGKANKACVRFLAGQLGVPASAVTIVRGSGSRDKVVRVTSVAEGRFQALLRRWTS
jgi:uncharacterized protein (TIGR00251 family)